MKHSVNNNIVYFADYHIVLHLCTKTVHLIFCAAFINKSMTCHSRIMTCSHFCGLFWFFCNSVRCHFCFLLAINTLFYFCVALLCILIEVFLYFSLRTDQDFLKAVLIWWIIVKLIEWLCERTAHLDIFLFFCRHSMVFYFQCSVYWWKESVRF